MAFAYQDEKHAHEHRVAKVGLLLSCIPLLCAMLGMPLVLEKSYGSFGEDLVAMPGLDTMDIASESDALVPQVWLRPKVFEKASCEFVPRGDLTMSPKIKFIRVIGERNSGVDNVAEALAKMFPNVTVGTGFTRGKYWFQQEKLLQEWDERVDLGKVLVVVVLRNSYDWLRMLRRMPIHAPSHVMRHDWRTFLTKTWTTRTSSVDKEISKVNGVKCQAKFLAGEVIPCRQSRFNMPNTPSTPQRQRRNMTPVYETNPLTMLPFNNVMELRKHKLLNYANMTTWVPKISFVKVESLFELSGVAKLRTVLAKNYNLAVCSTYGGAPVGFIDPFMRHPVSTLEEIDFVSCNVDWAAENLFGYTKVKPAAAASNEACSPDPSAARFAGKTYPVMEDGDEDPDRVADGALATPSHNKSTRTSGSSQSKSSSGKGRSSSSKSARNKGSSAAASPPTTVVPAEGSGDEDVVVAP